MKKSKIWIIGLVALLLMSGLVLITCDWLDGCPNMDCEYPKSTVSEREVCSNDTCKRTQQYWKVGLEKVKCDCE